MLVRNRSAAGLLVLGGWLAVAVFGAYALSLRGDFLWDDDLHVTANPTIIGPLGLKEIWTTARANYFPLVLTNFWVQHALWNLNPLGYRMVTLLFHAAAALLLWRVLVRLRVPGAWLGAALWALHPMQVESVAWICELKNTQSAVFFLSAIWFWIRWLEAGQLPGPPAGRVRTPERGSETRPTRTIYYVPALLCAVLALLSKPSTVMLPVALALCGWWMRGRIERRAIVALIPFFALSSIAAGWTIWEQRFHSGAIGPEWSQTFAERIAIAGKVVWFYLGKLAWPEPLIFIYPRWQIDAGQPLAYVGAIAVFGTLIVLWHGRRGWGRPLLFAATYFVAVLFPVLGFFSIYFFRYSFVGDHFQYLASMAPLALVGAAVARILPRALLPMGGLMVAALGMLTAHQSLVYRNNETLWRDTVVHNPNAVMAWLNLADTLSRAERHDEAIATFRHALTLRLDDPHAWNDLGCELTLTDRPLEAIEHLERALALKRDYPEAHNNLGNALRKAGRIDEAIAHYRRAIELKPKYAEALNNLGAEFAEAGKIEEAMRLFDVALALEPRAAATHDNLGSALQKLGRLDEAIAHHNLALRYNPKFAEAHANLGRALVTAERAQEALPYFERAVQIKPGFVAARSGLASALAALGRPAEALAQLERAAESSPQSAEAQLNLGVALARSGRVDEALGHFEAAVQFSPRFFVARLNLASALGAMSRWREAIPHLQVAIQAQPDNAAARAQLAVALVNTHQLEGAVPVFQRAIELNPTSAELHNNFGQLLRALGRNREALEHMEKAAELQRGSSLR